jgi:hypothetical protein
MYLKYGSYTHALDEASVVIQKTPRFSKSGSMTGYDEVWRISGKIHGTDVSDLTTKLTELERAYSSTNQNAYLLTDALGTTAHSIISSETASGVKVTSFGYPQGDGAEYVNFRTYEIILEAKKDASESNNGGDKGNTISFSQQISISGTGGPQFVVRTPRYGPPILQQVSRASPITISQSGNALGYKYYPNPEPPLYPQYLMPESHTVSRQSPQEDTKEGKRNFPINWSYNFIMVR